MSHFPFLPLQEIKSVCCLLLGQPSAHPQPQRAQQFFFLKRIFLFLTMNNRHFYCPPTSPLQRAQDWAMVLASVSLWNTKTVICRYVSLAHVSLGLFPKKLGKLSWPLKLWNSSTPLPEQQWGWTVPHVDPRLSLHPVGIPSSFVIISTSSWHWGGGLGLTWRDKSGRYPIEKNSKSLGGRSHWQPASKSHGCPEH